MSIFTQTLLDFLDRDDFSKNELINKTYTTLYKNIDDFKTGTKYDFDTFSSPASRKRKEIEQNYYNYIVSGLLHNIGEMKYYSNVNVKDSRRIIFTNNDCISLIHILFRDKIYFNVYMRSSDFGDAMLGDLEFFGSILPVVIKYLDDNKNSNSFSEINENYIELLKNQEVEFTVTFGSLHIN